MFSLPGTPVIRYGDEIGMGDDLSLPERHACRTPMQWSDEPQGGFTKSDKPVAPVISKGPFGFEHINVAEQRRSPDSLLNWMERLIRMRKEVPEIGWGDYTAVDTKDPGVLALRYDWRNNSVLIVHNLHPEPVEIDLDVGCGEHGKLLVDIADSESSEADEKGRHRLLLEAHAYRWFRVGGLDYLLRRTEI
jgi:maltose alpha-D-glucosyltransferase/alpha-amylase